MAKFNTDPMSMFHSKKVYKPRVQHEWNEQLAFCKYLKKNYPDIEYRSDMSSGTKKDANMQNISNILQSGSGFPDTQIYEPRKGYVGIMIELKRVDSGAILKDGSLSSAEHIQNQHRKHERLRQRGWSVHFAEGSEEAIRIFENYYL